MPTKKKRSLTSDFLDVGIGAVIGGATIGIVNDSNIPSNLKAPTNTLIGLGVLKGGLRLFK